MSFIYIKLVNFKCFLEREITLYEGLNFFVGDSGKGKTTVNKAIYFALYGGRKFKNIQNREHKDKPTMVLIHYDSATYKWRVTRTRPSESVTVEITDANGYFIFKDAAAQDWINKQFGVENIWLSSSYIGVTKPHFLINGSNSDKMELLQRIAYGDSSPQNQPETYLSAVRVAISYYNEKFKQLNESIKINEGIKQSYQTKNPLLVTYPYISEEETNQLISIKDKKLLEMETLRKIYTSLETKKQIIYQLDNLPIYQITLEKIREKIKLHETQRRKKNLEMMLTDFDQRVLTIDQNLLNNDDFLYRRYIQEGWDTKTDLEKFLKDIKDRLQLYKAQEKLEIRNKEITESNKKRADLNISLTKAYKKQQSDYDIIMEEIEAYNKRKTRIEEMERELRHEIYIKLSDDDDMSAQFVPGYKVMLSMGLDELVCPNCTHGLIYKGNKLELGTITNNCEDTKKKYSEKLALSTLEYSKRLKRDEYNKEITEFNRIIPRKKPDVPEEPVLVEMEELIPVKVIIKPTLEIFDLPTYSFEEYQKLRKSNSLKESYLEYLSIETVELKENLDDLLKLESQIKKTNDDKVRYETILATLPGDDPEIQDKINTLNSSIIEITAKINLAIDMKEIKRIEALIEQMTKELNSTVENLGHFNYYYAQTEELGMISLEKRINDINAPLKEILDTLFDEPISVKISPFKELKNGSTKLQVNLVVEHRNAMIEDYDDECSTGQIGRISIALLLAFARNNNNPFIILDEVLSSVEPNRQLDILEMLPTYSTGKFIINICHGVAEGSAKNVVYF